MKTAIYCRISQDQTGEGLGVSRQLEDCTKVADAAGWTVVEVYSDNDTSASSGKPRPEYRRMLRAIEDGEVEAIIAWAPDRLYRKLADLEELIPLVERHGTAIRTCRAGDFDLATPLGKMIARILGAVATGEGDVKTDRWKRSVRQRREAGAVPFARSRMFGYDREGIPLPDERDTVRWLAEEILAGRAVRSLLNELNERGILTTEGNAWSRATLRRLLLNPRIAGYATLSRREQHTDGNGNKVTRRAVDIVGRGTWEPLLDEATWEGVRAVLEARADSRPTPPRVALLPGIIFCGECGAQMVTGSRTTKVKGVLSRTYRCTREPGRGGCMKVSAQAEPVEQVVEAYTRTMLDDPRVRARLTDLRGQPGPRQHEVAELELRITELEQQLDEPGTPVATILRAIDRAKEKQEALLRELSAHPRTSVPAHGAEWPKDLRRRRALVDLVVERVTVNRGASGRFDPERVVITPRPATS